MVIWYLIVVHLIPSLASSEKERACNEQPPSIPNTYITPVVLQEYKHGTLLQYKCGQSFDQSGRNSYVTCVDGQWIRDLANMIRCIPGHCTQIDSREIDNGRVKSISGIVGTYAEFECDDGYELDGSAQILCMSDRKWHPKIPTCKPGLCTQIYSREIDNGRVKIISGMDGTYADFECDDGYELDGSAQILCMADRKWHPKIPTCKAISCPEPTQLINGKLTEEDYNGVRNTFQSTIRYECNKGYRMVGPQFRTCQSDRTWSGNDTKCEEILCDKPSPPENGKVYLTDNSEKVGSQIEYTCDERHKLVPNTSQFAICTEHGHWSRRKPECKKYCEVRSLQDGSFRDPNRLYWTITDDTYVLDNTELFFACGYGYEAYALGYDTNGRLKCYNGTWLPGSPECKPNRCQITETIPNGNLIYKGNVITEGMKIPSDTDIHLICCDGYEVYNESKATYMEKDNMYIKCAQGSFIDGFPSCIAKRCQISNITDNEAYDTSKENATAVGEKIPSGSTILLMCPVGYELYDESTSLYMERQDTNITCYQGRFEADILSCKPNRCQITETIPNGILSYKENVITEGMKIPSDNDIHLICFDGYELYNESKTTYMEKENMYIKCTQGSFICGFPSCKAKRCQISSTTVIETYDTSKENATAVGEKIPSGSTILLMCPVGYELYDESKSLYMERQDTNITCYQGRFEADIPSCKPKVLCESFDDYSLENGNIIYSYNMVNTVGTVVEFRCNPGYNRHGPESRTCQMDGTWSGTCVTCQSNTFNVSTTCPAPCIPEGARKIGSHTYEIGSKIEFRCTRSKSQSRASAGNIWLCIKNGEYARWDGKKINCKDTCSVPSVPGTLYNYNISNNTVLPGPVSSGRKVKVTCEEGYKLVSYSSNVSTCTNGIWEPALSHCEEKVECDSLSDNFKVIKVGVIQGKLSHQTIVEISCNKSQSPFDDVKTATCKETFWEPWKPYCANMCSVSSMPGTLYNFNISKKTVMPGPVSSGRKIKVTCEEGYNSVSYGSNVSICTNGIWKPSLSRCERKDCPNGTIYWNSTSYRKGPKKYISYKTYLTENDCFRSCEKNQSCKAVYINTTTNPRTLYCKLFASNTKDMPQEFTRSGAQTETIYDKACVEASERDVLIK